MKTREVDTDVGRIAVPDDGSTLTTALVERGAYEGAAAATLRAMARAGVKALDAGAGAGYYTLLLARSVGEGGSVIALEPDPALAELLERNAECASAPVRVVRAAAWRAGGEAEVGMSRRAAVPTVAVDDLLGEDGDVDVVRIDNDGTEHVAVQGMEHLVAGRRPAMLVGFWPGGIVKFGDNPMAVIEYYRELGYDPSLLEEPDLPTPVSAEDLIAAAERCPGARGTLALTPSKTRRGLLVKIRAAAGVVERGPQRQGGSLGPAGGFLRKVVLRLIRPYTAHQRNTDKQIVDALDELRLALIEVRATQDHQRSELKRYLREMEELRAELERSRGAAAELELMKARLESLDRDR